LYFARTSISSEAAAGARRKTFMTKQMAIVLMSVIVCAVPLTGSRQSNQSSEWFLKLKSGGAPGEKKFTVDLNQAGLLSVVEEDPIKLPKDPVTELTVNLTSKDLEEIYKQAVLVLSEPVPNPRKKDDETIDGTWINLELATHGRSVARGYHVALIQEEVPVLAKLLELINKHVPKDHQVY
jgi:hypothetical protein